MRTTTSQTRPPGPTGAAAAVRTLAAFRRDMFAAIRELQARHGDMVRVRIGPRVAYLLGHPDLIEYVVRSNHKNYTRDEFLRNARVLFGDGLLVSEGDLWKRQRKLMSPAFAQRRIGRYAATMVECADVLATRWTGEVRDLGVDMAQLTLEIAVRTLFGTTAAGDGPRIGAALEDLMAYFSSLVGVPIMLPMWLPTANNRRLKRGRAVIHDVVDAIIQRRRAEPEDDSSADDLLTTMMRARDDDGHSMSDAQLRDEVLTLLLAGHETTAMSLTCTLHLLARHPEIEARVVEELDRVLGGRPPTQEDLKTLEFTRRVALEGLRLYPPGAIMGREALGPDTVGGYDLPAGAWIVASQWLVHRDGRFFPEPERFDPDRWTPEFQRNLPRFAYFPFGGGHRVCIGQSFAMMELCLLLATLLQRFRVEAIDPAPIEVLMSITIRPRRPVMIRPRPRG